MNWSKCLITGGAGFIGSQLARQLAGSGKQVVCVDNLVNGKIENVEGVPNVRMATADIRDLAAMRPLVNSTEVVFHLACLGVRHSLHSPAENHAVNATGTLGLLQIARECGVRRFVYVSTSEVYGTAMRVPMDEGHPTIPKTVYGASKLAGECYARAFHDTYGLPTVIVRPFNAFGPRCHHEGDSGEVIPKFLLRALAGKPLMVFGDGSQTRDFTYVEDTARAIALAGESDQAVGETINVGQGREITILQLAETVARLIGRDRADIQFMAPRPADVLRLCADATRARQLLGYDPNVSLSEGLARLLEWYRSLPATPDELLQTEQVRNWGALAAPGVFDAAP